VADSIAKLDAARSLVYVTARHVDEGFDSRRMVSEAKKTSTEMLWEVVNHSMQVMGGIGYTNVYPIERFFRDARMDDGNLFQEGNGMDGFAGVKSCRAHFEGFDIDQRRCKQFGQFRIHILARDRIDQVALCLERGGHSLIDVIACIYDEYCFTVHMLSQSCPQGNAQEDLQTLDSDQSVVFKDYKHATLTFLSDIKQGRIEYW
jgi:hypothetical protein